MDKADYLIIAKERGLQHTKGALATKTITELKALIGEISESENQTLAAKRDQRKVFNGVSNEELKGLCQRHLLPVTGTKNQLIDRLLSLSTELKATLPDPSQQSVIDNWQNREQIISAGPGAGKTTTLARLVAHILEQTNNKARIAVITFNIIAEKIFNSRLKTVGVKSVNRKMLLESSGVFVVTFNKYAQWARAKTLFTNGNTRDDPDDDFIERNVDPEFLSRGVSANPHAPAKSYEATFEQQINTPPSLKEVWDWLIIDEAQDLGINHVRLIDQIRPRSKHFVIAGDPRQEIRQGAGWFSNLWRESKERTALKYNHRATPAVVNFLNRFSREHFPDLHYDQISSIAIPFDKLASENPQPKFELCPGLEAAGIRGAELLLSQDRKSAYCLSPVTDRRYKSGDLKIALRQAFYELAPGQILHSRDDDNDKIVISQDADYAFGTSHTFKGSERDLVVVVQSDIPYKQYGFPNEYSMKRLIYVAISRARKWLYVLLTTPPDRDDIWFNLVPTQLQSIIPRQLDPLQSRTNLMVRDDLAKLDVFVRNVMAGEIATIPKVDVVIINDADFIGILVEMILAGDGSGGATTPAKYRFESAKIVDGRPTTELGLRTSPDGVKIVTFDPRKQVNLEGIISDLKTAPNEYKDAVIAMSAQMSKLWTVSERFKTKESHPDISHVKAVLDKICEGLMQHGKVINREIIIHRSEIVAGQINGVTDFSFSASANSDGGGADGQTVELKHAEPVDWHKCQVALYGGLDSTKKNYLINTKTGTINAVIPFNTSLIINSARGVLALKTAISASSRIRNKLPHVPATRVYIALDLEFMNQYVYEVGAIAYDSSTCDNVIGVFHRLASQTYPEFNPQTEFERITNLKQIEYIDPIDQAKIKSEFNNWIQSLSQNVTFIIWGSSDHDLRLLGLSNVIETSEIPPGIDKKSISMQKINVFRLFKIWLERNNQGRSNACTLSDAVNQLMPTDFKFVAHRAFEDAVATACVLRAIVE